MPSTWQKLPKSFGLSMDNLYYIRNRQQELMPMTEVYVRLGTKIGDILVTAVQGMELYDPESKLAGKELHLMVSIHNPITTLMRFPDKYGRNPSSQTATFISDGRVWEEGSPRSRPGNEVLSQEIIDICEQAAKAFVNEGKSSIKVPFIDITSYAC